MKTISTLAAFCLAVTCSSALARNAGAVQSAGGLAGEHTVVPLWEHGAPDSHAGTAAETIRISPEGDHVLTHVEQPSITLYLPAGSTATGAAVVVVPGGGHSEIWIDHEGYNVAQFLSNHGVAAFVLEYRLAREKGSSYTVEGTELGDLQRAIRTVRHRANEWGADPTRLGVIGFSAGGELAALASTRGDAGAASAADVIDRESSQPDFQGLLYPAIPKDPRLTPKTSKAFLACGTDDRADISQGLAEYYLALSRLHVSAELHIYAGVGHGFGMRSSNKKAVGDWPELFLEWMNTEKLLQR